MPSTASASVGEAVDPACEERGGPRVLRWRFHGGSQRWRSEEIRDIARAQQLGPHGEVGWLSWKWYPQGMAQRLERGGLVVVDGPAMCRELSQPKTTLEEALLDYIMGGGAK